MSEEEKKEEKFPLSEEELEPFMIGAFMMCGAMHSMSKSAENHADTEDVQNLSKFELVREIAEEASRMLRRTLQKAFGEETEGTTGTAAITRSYGVYSKVLETVREIEALAKVGLPEQKEGSAEAPDPTELTEQLLATLQNTIDKNKLH